MTPQPWPTRLLQSLGRWLQRWRARLGRPAGPGSDEEAAAEATEPENAPGDPPAHWLERVRSAAPPAHWLERVQQDAPEFLEGRAPLDESQSAERQPLPLIVDRRPPTADHEMTAATLPESTRRPKTIGREPPRRARALRLRPRPVEVGPPLAADRQPPTASRQEAASPIQDRPPIIRKQVGSPEAAAMTRRPRSAPPPAAITDSTTAAARPPTATLPGPTIRQPNRTAEERVAAAAMTGNAPSPRITPPSQPPPAAMPEKTSDFSKKSDVSNLGLPHPSEPEKAIAPPPGRPAIDHWPKTIRQRPPAAEVAEPAAARVRQVEAATIPPGQTNPHNRPHRPATPALHDIPPRPPAKSVETAPRPAVVRRQPSAVNYLSPPSPRSSSPAAAWWPELPEEPAVLTGEVETLLALRPAWERRQRLDQEQRGREWSA